jgi:hypothetical protein
VINLQAYCGSILIVSLLMEVIPSYSTAELQ